MIHVITKIERPSKDVVEQFRRFGAATVHEASGRKGAVDPAIKPIRKGLRLCGPAFTVQCAPGDNLMLHKALEKAQPGDVLVASVSGYPEGGYFGGLMAVSALARRLGGLAIDGCIRDSEEIIAMGFPIFARGFCIRGTSKSVPGLVNHPTVFGGIRRPAGRSHPRRRRRHGRGSACRGRVGSREGASSGWRRKSRNRSSSEAACRA